jgi:hypothetical protein
MVCEHAASLQSACHVSPAAVAAAAAVVRVGTCQHAKGLDYLLFEAAKNPGYQLHKLQQI